MTPAAQIVKTRFMKSIIRSKVSNLSHDHDPVHPFLMHSLFLCIDHLLIEYGESVK